MSVMRTPLASKRMRRPGLAVCYLASLLFVVCLLGNIPSIQRQDQLLEEEGVAGSDALLEGVAQSGWLLTMGGILAEGSMGQMPSCQRRGWSEATAAGVNLMLGRSAGGVQRMQHVTVGAKGELLIQPQEEAHNKKYLNHGCRYCPQGPDLSCFAPPPIATFRSRVLIFTWSARAIRACPHGPQCAADIPPCLALAGIDLEPQQQSLGWHCPLSNGHDWLFLCLLWHPLFSLGPPSPGGPQYSLFISRDACPSESLLWHPYWFLSRHRPALLSLLWQPLFSLRRHWPTILCRFRQSQSTLFSGLKQQHWPLPCTCRSLSPIFPRRQLPTKCLPALHAGPSLPGRRVMPRCPQKRSMESPRATRILLPPRMSCLLAATQAMHLSRPIHSLSSSSLQFRGHGLFPPLLG